VVYPSGNKARTRKYIHSRRKDTRTINKSNVIELKKPEKFIDDPITEVLLTGARRLLAEALEVEIKE
jgi:hypothetical protein